MTGAPRAIESVELSRRELVISSLGGVLETVRAVGTSWPTGSFFGRQAAAAIAETLPASDEYTGVIDPLDCRRNAERFAVDRFRAAFKSLVESTWADFAPGRR